MPEFTAPARPGRTAVMAALLAVLAAPVLAQTQLPIFDAHLH